ncbi:hypothetical protein DesLBE_3683 [Desulfitobacterium sp. LBE]|uniref:hypothetical protein n=1 Tax=Desulfitobacterium sp. LBE TaxID=884086 RepID=UPI00119967D4|nr:hypothetical protein [Desulfitobacterium sp. LBE]TWH59308.1 hypothetical protein DesLBE_3683 [Desulfitobacterium sp. LBE]
MDEKLYIPMGVKTETEIFPGFGRREFLQSIVGSVGTGVLAFLIWAFSRNVTPSVICILTGIVGSVMMTTKDQSNLSVVDQVRNMVGFMRSQKYYPYAYGDEWRLGK